MKKGSIRKTFIPVRYLRMGGGVFDAYYGG